MLAALVRGLHDFADRVETRSYNCAMLASSATLSSNSSVFNVATDSQVMKKYMTIRQEPSLAVKHFRCTACLRDARVTTHWTRKPFVCKDFLHVADS